MKQVAVDAKNRRQTARVREQVGAIPTRTALVVDLRGRELTKAKHTAHAAESTPLDPAERRASKARRGHRVVDRDNPSLKPIRDGAASATVTPPHACGQPEHT